MSQPQPEQPLDSDPLLGFSIEPGVISSDTSANPIAPALDTRVDHLESSVDELVDRVASLKSELATLVGAIDDISKRLARLPVPAPPRAKAPAPRAIVRSATAVVGVALGIGIAAAGWGRWSQDSITGIGSTASLVAATPAAAALVPSTVEPAPVAPAPVATATATPPHASPLPGQASPRLVPAAMRVNYVGTLSIDAQPGGDVFLNRKAAGHTPLRVENLKAGSHLVWIERDGYRRWTQVVQVPSNRVTRLSAALEPVASR